jgi:hypothetical protein
MASLIRSTSRRSLAPANGRLYAACCATAPAVLGEVVKIFGSVIVGYFFPRCDGTQRHEHDPTVAHHGLRVRPTGMIDITCHIPSWRSIDNPSTVEYKHIFCTFFFAFGCFLDRHAPTAIDRDISGPFDELRSEQAEPGCRAADTEGA